MIDIHLPKHSRSFSLNTNPQDNFDNVTKIQIQQIASKDENTEIYDEAFDRIFQGTTSGTEDENAYLCGLKVAGMVMSFLPNDITINENFWKTLTDLKEHLMSHAISLGHVSKNYLKAFSAGWDSYYESNQNPSERQKEEQQKQKELTEQALTFMTFYTGGTISYLSAQTLAEFSHNIHSRVHTLEECKKALLAKGGAKIFYCITAFCVIGSFASFLQTPMED